MHGTFALASFPVPRPAFRHLQYGKAVLLATKSWAMAWERGYLCPSWNSKKSKGTRKLTHVRMQLRMHVVGDDCQALNVYM